MSPQEVMARAIAAVDGDPDELVPVRSPAGKLNVPRWTKYRGKADAALQVQFGFPDAAAAADVLAERQRQVRDEGHTPEADDTYTGGELARAGGAYAYRAGQPDAVRESLAGELFPHFWPWDPEHWKPGDRRCELVKAGALIIAEIGRLDRAEARAEEARG